MESLIKASEAILVWEFWTNIIMKGYQLSSSVFRLWFNTSTLLSVCLSVCLLHSTTAKASIIHYVCLLMCKTQIYYFNQEQACIPYSSPLIQRLARLMALALTSMGQLCLLRSISVLVSVLFCETDTSQSRSWS